MTVFQWIVVPLATLLAVYQVRIAFRQRARLVPGMVWASVFGAIAVCVGRPGIPNQLAHWLGIGRGADLVLYSTAVLLILALRWSYARYRYLEQVHTALVRELALERARFGGQVARDAQPQARKSA